MPHRIDLIKEKIEDLYYMYKSLSSLNSNNSEQISNNIDQIITMLEIIDESKQSTLTLIKGVSSLTKAIILLSDRVRRLEENNLNETIKPTSWGN